ncbi:MAG: DUF1318 domain-containing protein [Desulfocapsa sp.]|nr:MAG: DUF1318 domain-containing protein [Desulfocapsa sp.]
MKKIIYSFILALILVAGTTHALDLRSAKTQGLVGETASGYLAPVNTGDAVVKALVSDINAKRKAHYQGIAQANKTPLQTVEELAGKKAISKTPAGQFIKNGSAWQKK